MKIIKFMQEGGVQPAAPVNEAPAEAQNPLLQIADIFAQGLQNGDCNMLAQGAEMFIQLIAQEMGQGPVDQAPQGQPVFKKGGKLIKRKKCSK